MVTNTPEPGHCQDKSLCWALHLWHTGPRIVNVQAPEGVCLGALCLLGWETRPLFLPCPQVLCVLAAAPSLHVLAAVPSNFPSVSSTPDFRTSHAGP